MRFALSAVSAVLALAASAFAQTADFDPINVPDTNQEIAAGSTFTIEWEAPAKYAGGTVSIELIGGATQNTQIPLGTITTGVQNSAKSYQWHVDAALGDQAVYGLVFKLESNPAIFQYSKPFHIKKGAYAPPGKTSQTTTTTLTTSVGVKTVTLHTTTPSTTSAAPIPTTDVTVVRVATTTVPCNTTTLATSTKLPVYTTPLGTAPALTSAVWAAPSGPPASAPSAPSAPGTPPAVPSHLSGASSVGASSLALVGGLVMAFFAL